MTAPTDLPTALAALGMVAPYELHMSELLRGGEPTNTLEEVKAFKQISALPPIGKLDKQPNTLINIGKLDDHHIDGIHGHYGEAGLFRLLFLAMTSSLQDFEHFSRLITDDLSFRDLWGQQTTRDLSHDNPCLHQSRELDRFCSNVIQPSLSRKLYNPGVHHGFLVYGLGGPRILVSHPFRGASQQLYDVFNNSIDVVTSLTMKGYYGTFLFLDYLQGLNRRFFDVEGWTLWFSIISAHSDLVLFVKEEGKDFGVSQKMELNFTPDRIPKKVVQFPAGELRWAKQYEREQIPDKVLNVVPGIGMATDEQWELEELKFARPFLENYERGSFPNDRLIVIEENGKIRELPLSG
jgi:hypothetical protein